MNAIPLSPAPRHRLAGHWRHAVRTRDEGWQGRVPVRNRSSSRQQVDWLLLLFWSTYLLMVLGALWRMFG